MTETAMNLNIDPTHIAFRCGTEDPRHVVADLEAALADAKARRDQILVDLGKVSIAIDKGDHRARFVQANLNKQEVAAGRLVNSIAKQVEMARKHVEMADNQAAAVAEKAAAAAGAPVGRLVQLEISAPDGRTLMQWHKSIDAARKVLQHGYEITGEVISSGVVSPVGNGARPFMKALLDLQGDTLLAWLAEHGINKQAVIVLPSNGRD
jgi:hypothetical protein